MNATNEQLWARYDELASNPIEQARWALHVRLHESPRPAPLTPVVPVVSTVEDPRLVQYRELKQTNPILAARYALANDLFNK